MLPFEPYEIRHVDIDRLTEVTVPSGNCFVLCWSGRIPLAHCWITVDQLPSSAEVYIRMLAQACQPARDFYAREPIEEKQGPRPGLSIVICTRQRAASLADCLHSLKNNTDQDYDLIVVDNAPDDPQTRNLLKSFPEIRYIPELRKGLSIARNTGARAALHPVIAYIDDDVLVPDHWVGKMKSCFDNPETMVVTGLVLPRELRTDSQYQFEKYWGFNRGYIPKTFDYPYFLEHLSVGVPVWDIGAGANMAFRREAFELVGGFDERLGAGASGCSEDSEFWYRILAAGWKCVYIPSLYAFHLHRDTDRALAKQLHDYMRGHVSALLVQHREFNHPGNLSRLYRQLPKQYYYRLKQRLINGDKQNAEHIFGEIRGMISGWFYYYLRRRDPGYSIPFFMPYAINRRSEVHASTLVSVIIPCHELGQYLPQAIESVLNQDHSAVEVIVVDSSEQEDIATICRRYEGVRYVRAARTGVSMKRNIGVQYSRGEFLVFLDADDFLYPQGISGNLHYFSLYPSSAFVSGGFDRVGENGKFLEAGATREIGEHNFITLLRENYIGMEGNVMYKRSVFFSFHFDPDPAVKGSEDYLLHLQISRYFPTYSHTGKIVAYRIHRRNLSNDRIMMLKSTLNTLRRQKKVLFCKSERDAFRKGLRNWKDYYNR
jgi:glycosyltransferase involved in cell wall biosynthesis